MASPLQRRFQPLLLSGLCGLLWLPLAATAQIASPSNAGGNSGNNSSGSSESPISTPNFSGVQTVAAAAGVSVDADGTVSAAPEVQRSVNNAVVSAISTPEVDPLAPVLGANPPTVSATDLVNTEVPPEIVLASGAGQSEQTFLTLADEIAKEFNAGTIGSDFKVTNLRTGNTGKVELAQDSGNTGRVVLVQDSIEVTVVFPVTGQNQVALAQFAAIGIAAGLAPQAIAAGLQIVAAGATPIQVTQLMVSLQGLAAATTLTPLSNGINAFNAILSSTLDPGIPMLANNSVFLAARAVLIAARTTLSA